MKKLFATLIFTVTALSCLCIPVSAKVYNGWTQEDGNWHCYINGERITGEQIIADKTYYFDEDGNMVDKHVESKPVEPKPVETPEEIKPTETPKLTAKNGWISDNSGWHVYKNDQMIKNDWYQDKSKWYYLDKNGIMVTGWEKISNKWYYFDTSGAMITGWKMIDNSWYYFKSSGEMHTGWLQIKSGDPWYYMNSGGKMVTGWNEIGGKWYCFKSSGEMYADCTTPDGAKVGKDGAKIIQANTDNTTNSNESVSITKDEAYSKGVYATVFLKRSLKNPNSLILNSISVYQYDKEYTIVNIDYSAMNGFGGYNRETVLYEISSSLVCRHQSYLSWEKREKYTIFMIGNVSSGWELDTKTVMEVVNKVS